MTRYELEHYLLVNGFETGIAPEVYKVFKEDKYEDLGEEPAARLTTENDYLRMDLRIVAEDITRGRRELAKARGVRMSDLPFRIQE